MDAGSASIIVASIGLFGVFITAIVAYRQGANRVTQDLQIEYDKDLRVRRIRAYGALPQKLRPLARYPQLEPLTHDRTLELTRSLSDWYFDAGGLFLSTTARDQYFALQDSLKIVLQKQAGQWPLGEDTVSEEDLRRCLGYLDRQPKWICPPKLFAIAKAAFERGSDTVPMPIMEQLRLLGHDLRTGLVDDVLTRQPLRQQRTSER